MAEEYVSVQTEMGQVLSTNLSGPRRAKYVQLSLRHDPLTLSGDVPDVQRHQTICYRSYPLCAAE